MKRNILKLLLIFGVPLGGYYLLYGAGVLVNMFAPFIDISPDLPIWIDGFLGIVAVLFCGLMVSLAAWGLWTLAENVLDSLEDMWIDFKRSRENRRINRLSQHDSPLPEDLSQADRTEMLRNFEQQEPVDEDRAYRQRIGVEEEDTDRTRPPGPGRINFMG